MGDKSNLIEVCGIIKTECDVVINAESNEDMYQAIDGILELIPLLLKASDVPMNTDGGPGSGNWGHGGRPGKKGGSAGGTGGVQHRTGTKESGFSSASKEKAAQKKAASGGGGSSAEPKEKAEKKSATSGSVDQSKFPGVEELEFGSHPAFEEQGVKKVFKLSEGNEDLPWSIESEVHINPKPYMREKIDSSDLNKEDTYILRNAMTPTIEYGRMKLVRKESSNMGDSWLFEDIDKRDMTHWFDDLDFDIGLVVKS